MQNPLLPWQGEDLAVLARLNPCSNSSSVQVLQCT
jgi:hypothetical protein